MARLPLFQWAHSNGLYISRDGMVTSEIIRQTGGWLEFEDDCLSHSPGCIVTLW